MTTTDRLVAQRVLVRDMPDRSRIVATLRIHHLQGNAHPYFSATCDIYEAHGTHSGASRSRRGLDMDSGGASHAEILAAFPGAAAFVRVHLSDYPSGVPMHAEANAWHFLTRASAEYEAKHYGEMWPIRHGNGPTRAARLLRLGSPEALPYDILAAHRAGALTEEHRAAFGRFVDAQRPRWAAEARAARDLLELMPDTTDLRGYDVRGDAIERLQLPSWLIGADAETVDV